MPNVTIQAKETLVIEKDPVFVPVESWLTAAQVNKMITMILMRLGKKIMDILPVCLTIQDSDEVSLIQNQELIHLSNQSYICC